MRRALDLFCGGGGAARGILAAGFDEVTGVDWEIGESVPPAYAEFIAREALRQMERFG